MTGIITRKDPPQGGAARGRRVSARRSRIDAAKLFRAPGPGAEGIPAWKRPQQATGSAGRARIGSVGVAHGGHGALGISARRRCPRREPCQRRRRVGASAVDGRRHQRRGVRRRHGSARPADLTKYRHGCRGCRRGGPRRRHGAAGAMGALRCRVAVHSYVHAPPPASGPQRHQRWPSRRNQHPWHLSTPVGLASRVNGASLSLRWSTLTSSLPCNRPRFRRHRPVRDVGQRS